MEPPWAGDWALAVRLVARLMAIQTVRVRPGIFIGELLEV
jgi:hypothetical protein